MDKVQKYYTSLQKISKQFCEINNKRQNFI